MEDPAAFGRRLLHARVDQGMSQTALAAGICSPSSISRWEDGQSIPDSDTTVQLAQRLGLSPAVLTGIGFDSRLAASADGFADLLHTVFTRFPTSVSTDFPPSIHSWITQCRNVLESADPWSASPLPRSTVDNLAVDPLTTSSPTALETVELLDALLALREDTTARSVDALVNTLTWAVDAPTAVRHTAMESAVAVLVSAEMPVAARSAVMTVSPTAITLTTAALLEWHGPTVNGLPPVCTFRTARDVAVDVLVRNRTSPDQVRYLVADSVRASCPNDGFVEYWSSML